MQDRLRNYGLHARIGPDGFFPNTISAVEAQPRRTTTDDHG